MVTDCNVGDERDRERIMVGNRNDWGVPMDCGTTRWDNR